MEKFYRFANESKRLLMKIKLKLSVSSLYIGRIFLKPQWKTSIDKQMNPKDF